MISAPWFGLGVSLGIGLLIGLERERSKGVGSGRRPAGIRTFTLASLLGAVAMHLGGEAFLALVTAGVMILTALAYVRDRSDDPGLTTEIGLLVTPLLGGLAMSDTSLAAGLGAAVAVIFAAKAPLHGFITRILTGAEVTDGLVFAVATLIIWPQLPDRYLGPLQALNPHSIWFLVILIMAIGACGHAATRALGVRFGLPIAGLASGFVSSTATIGSMAGRATRDPASMRAAVAGAAFSTVATFIQLALLLATISRSTLLLMAPALVAGAIVAALYGLGFALRAVTPDGISAAEPGRAFSVGTALGLAAMMAAMLVVSAALQILARGGRRDGRGGRSGLCRYTFAGDLDRLLGRLGENDTARCRPADPCRDDEQRRGENSYGDRRRVPRLYSAHHAGNRGANCLQHGRSRSQRC